MKIKIMMCMEKHVVRGYELELDTDDHPKLKALIDNGTLPDLSRGGELADGGRYWRCEDTGLEMAEFLTQTLSPLHENWENESFYGEHFTAVDSWDQAGTVWENDAENPEIVGFIPQMSGESES